MAQMVSFDLSDRYASLDAKKGPLVEINDVVPWEEFRPLLEQVWRKPESERKSRAGRKPIDAVLMFKTLVLSALYNLSDDQVEYQIRDRLSFTRFLGLVGAIFATSDRHSSEIDHDHLKAGVPDDP